MSVAAPAAAAVVRVSLLSRFSCWGWRQLAFVQAKAVSVLGKTGCEGRAQGTLAGSDVSEPQGWFELRVLHFFTSMNCSGSFPRS